MYSSCKRKKTQNFLKLGNSNTAVALKDKMCYFKKTTQWFFIFFLSNIFDVIFRLQRGE